MIQKTLRPPPPPKHRQVLAFTLAEVLITLGIIGVVAAMTIPTLIQSYNKRTIETKLKKIHSVMNQVILLSEIDNGPKERWPQECGASSTITCEDYFKQYILPYIKTGTTKEQETNGDDNIAIYFSDGSVLICKKGYDYYYYPNGHNFSWDTFYVQGESGFTRPDIGISAFSFRFAPAKTSAEDTLHKGRGFDAYMYGITELTEDAVRNGSVDSNYGCHKDAKYKHYCTAWIKMNGWKIPDDYPFDVR